MQTVLLIIAVFAAVAAAVLGGVAVALALRSQRTHASELELARRAAESAQRAAVAMDAASSTLAQVNAVLAGLSSMRPAPRQSIRSASMP